MIDLTEFKYLFTFGYSLDIYAYGSLRIMVDRHTGKQILSYVV